MIYSHLPHPLPIERLLYKHGHMFVSINELTPISNSYFLFFFPYRAFSLTWPSAMQMFGIVVIEIGKCLFESLIIKQWKVYMYLIFYYWGHNQGGSQVLLPTTLNHLNFIVESSVT